MNSEMDELYRKAAENYPLNTGKPAWEALLQKMETYEQNNTKSPNRKNGLISLLMLLLILPLAVSDIEFSKNIFSYSDNKIKTGDKIEQQNSITQINDDDNGIGDDNIVRQGNSIATLNKFHQPHPGKLTGHEKKVEKNNEFIVTNNSNTLVETIPALPATTDERIPTSNVTTVTGNKNSETIKSTKAEPLNTTQEVPVSTKQTGEKKDKSKKFYAGIIAGPEVNSVKMQNLYKVGLNAGIIAGIQLNKNIQVETGVLFNKKYYKSKGEYFKTNKISLPAGASISEVEGYCNMIEIPVNINYVIKQAPGHSIYVSGGVSSYIMKKEVYSFEVSRNGYTYPRDMNYDNPGTYAFATINLGAGYNKKMGKNGNLRIAPSIKLPVKKIGTGSLPIQSATLYLGYTHHLF